MDMECDQPSSTSNPNALFRSASSYIVSAQKPTVVNGCVVGNFRNAEDLDLIISRINRIEMLIMTEEGLKPYREIAIFGRIAIIKAFKAVGEVKLIFDYFKS
jgi:DNA damage-binding protein 1